MKTLKQADVGLRCAVTVLFLTGHPPPPQTLQKQKHPKTTAPWGVPHNQLPWRGRGWLRTEAQKAQKGLTAIPECLSVGSLSGPQPLVPLWAVWQTAIEVPPRSGFFFDETSFAKRQEQQVPLPKCKSNSHPCAKSYTEKSGDTVAAV